MILPFRLLSTPGTVFCLLLLSGLGHAGRVTAAENFSTETSYVSPRVFGLDIPPGRVTSGEDRRVATRDEQGRGVVAMVHCQVGDNLIVMLPDGQLVARSQREVEATQRPFAPATKDEIAKQLVTGPLEGFQTKQTRRYLYIYNTSETFALTTSRILETMFPGVMAYAEAQKIDVAEPEVPLVVIMFKTEEEFRKFEDVPGGMVAYYNTVDNRVVMYEQSRIGQVRHDLGVQQAVSTIAHEGAHQILHNIGVQQRLSVWPMWLGEGLAEFFAPTSVENRLKWKGAGQVNDMRMFELEQYLKSRPADADGRLIEDTVQAASLTSTGYAAAWSLTHYLAKHHRAEFHKYVHEVSRLKPLEGNLRIDRPGLIPSNKTTFERHFGNDYALTEQRLIAHLNRLPYVDPFADSPHLAAMMTYPLGRRVGRDAEVFRTQAQAAKWYRDRRASLSEEDRAKTEFGARVFPNKAAALRFVKGWIRGG